MAAMERLRTADGREILFLAAPDPQTFAATYRVPGHRHRLLLAWDAEGLPTSTVETPIVCALDEGCVAFAAWGLDCERVHDLCDETFLARIDTGDEQAQVMTIWLPHDPFAEALFNLFFVLNPFDEWFDDSDTYVVGVIGDERLRARVRDGIERYDAGAQHGDAAVRLVASDPACARTLAAWFMEEWHAHYSGRRVQDVANDFLPAPGSKVPLALVASIDGELVGTVSVRGPWDAAPQFHPPWIGGLYVRPEFRGRGFGSQLVECAVAAARKLGCGEVHAAVRAPDVPSYLRKSWEVVGAVEADDGPVTVIRRETRKNQASGAP